jgi:deoxyhypusine synthase
MSSCTNVVERRVPGNYETIQRQLMLAAAKKNIPIVVPGWEDSTMGNIFSSYIIKNDMKATTMKK